MKALKQQRRLGLFALLLAVVLLAGCAASPQASFSPAATAAATTISGGSSAAPSTTPELTEPSTLKCLVPDNNLAGLPFSFNDRGEINSWKFFEEKLLNDYLLNLDFEIIENTQYFIVMQTRLAAALDLPDYMNITDNYSTLTAYANSGMFLAVDELVSEYCLPETQAYIQERYPFALTEVSNPLDGHTYWIGTTDISTINGVPRGNANVTLTIRQDWLDKLDLPMPQSMDEIIDTGKSFHSMDANGNDIMGDELWTMDSAGGAVPYGFFGYYFGLVNNLTDPILETGEVVSPWLQEGMLPWVTFMRDMYSEGLIDFTVGIVQNNAENRMIGTIQFAFQSMYDNANPDKDCFFVPLPFFNAVDGISAVAVRGKPYTVNQGFTFAFTKACDDKVAAARLLDALFTDWYTELTNYGIEGENWEVANGYEQANYGYYDSSHKFIIADGSLDDMRANNSCAGVRLWGKGIFPWIRTIPNTTEGTTKLIAQYEADGDWRNAIRQQEAMKSWEYQPEASHNKGAYYGIATDEEASRKNELVTDIETYASELLVNLVTGVKSLENWDSYISDLKQMGLEELIGIDQTLYNRMNGD
ncbi:MAG: hypothetical protein ACOX8S_05645 [Christensenellales bacterium]|jgi:putative aldouronate transport system substrate-binding protein